MDKFVRGAMTGAMRGLAPLVKYGRRGPPTPLLVLLLPSVGVGASLSNLPPALSPSLPSLSYAPARNIVFPTQQRSATIAGGPRAVSERKQKKAKNKPIVSFTHS